MQRERSKKKFLHVNLLTFFTSVLEEVAACLYNLDISKASGPDGIPARNLKKCSHQIAPSICDLFNHSLRTGRLPSQWKSADVPPIHKKDLKEPVENYRPISLLPIISKVLKVVFPGDSTMTSFTSSHHHNMVFLEIVRVSLSLSKFFTLLVSVLTKTFSLI